MGRVDARGFIILIVLIWTMHAVLRVSGEKGHHVLRDGGCEHNTLLDSDTECSPFINSTSEKDRATSMTDIIKLLEEGTPHVHAKDEQGKTFLHVILSDKNPPSPSEFHELTALLVSKNQTGLFDTRGGLEGFTPLQVAMFNVEVESSTLTLLNMDEVGVDWNGMDNGGNSLLAYALMGRRNIKFLKQLILLGARLEASNRNHESLLHTAAKWGNVEGMAYLLASGLSANALDKFGNSPLHHLVRHSNQRQVWRGLKLLINNGADVSIQNGDGKTALSTAKDRRFINGEKIVQALSTSKKFGRERRSLDGSAEEATANVGICSINGTPLVKPNGSIT